MKPAAVPSSGMAGGANANTNASLMPASAIIARPATALMPSSSDSRSLQSLSVTKAMPLFWPLPPKLKPCTLNTDSTVSFSFSRKCCSSFSIDCIVRCWVEPTGVCTWANSMPWSSAGRNELGRRMNSSPITTSIAAKIARKRFGRPRMPRTPRW